MIIVSKMADSLLDTQKLIEDIIEIVISKTGMPKYPIGWYCLVRKYKPSIMEETETSMGWSSFMILAGIAIYPDKSTTTATQIKISTSPDNSTWVDKRLVNMSELTDGAWNFLRWNLDTVQEQYVRIYGTDGTSKILAIWEIKVLIPTQLQVTMRHSHKSISPSTAGLGVGA